MGIGYDPKKEYYEIIEQAAQLCGCTVYESHIRLKGPNTRITVKIDSDSKVTHADCERYSRELSRLLDENGSLPNYWLEISSPGFDRKLQTPAEYSRFVGSPVKVIYENNGGKVAKGTLLAADETAITVNITEEKRDAVIPYSLIKRANLDY
jgi:ribosome maturation factor RimP